MYNVSVNCMILAEVPDLKNVNVVIYIDVHYGMPGACVNRPMMRTSGLEKNLGFLEKVFRFLGFLGF